MILMDIYPVMKVHVGNAQQLQFQLCMSAAKSANQVKGKVSSQVQNVSCADPFILPLSVRNDPARHKPATQMSGYITAGETVIKVQVWTLTGCHRIIFRGHKVYRASQNSQIHLIGFFL